MKTDSYKQVPYTITPEDGMFKISAIYKRKQITVYTADKDVYNNIGDMAPLPSRILARRIAYNSIRKQYLKE